MDLAAQYREKRAARLAVQAQQQQAQAAAGRLRLQPLQLAPAAPPPAWLKWGLGAMALVTLGIVWSSTRRKR